MKELQELAYILTKQKISKIEIIGDEYHQQDSKMYQLFRAVQEGKVNSDEEAAQLLYNSPKNSAKYRNLKFHLKKRLLNTVLFIESNTNNNRAKIYQECWKEWAACNIVRIDMGDVLATKIAKGILKKAVKFEFDDLIIPVSLFLRNYYAIRYENKTKFDYYNQLYKRHEEIYKYNNLAKEYYNRLLLDHAVKTVAINPRIKEDSDHYYNLLKPFKDKIQSKLFHYTLFQIRLLGAMGIYDYERAKQICIEGLTLIENPQKGKRINPLNFYLNKLVCHIQLREFEEGKQTAQKCEQLLTAGTFNWFKTKEYLFMLAMHTENYQEAYTTYWEVMNNKRFKQYKELLEETWHINRMYLHFLVLSQQVKVEETDTTFNKIRLGRFLNQVPSFSKDKSGMNIPVLIIQLAFLIIQQHYDQAEERIDALTKYLSRHIKSDSPQFRCYYFIKVLMQIPILGFQLNGLDKKVRKYFDKMQTVEINFNSQAHELEVLPFPVLWNFIKKGLAFR